MSLEPIHARLAVHPNIAPPCRVYDRAAEEFYQRTAHRARCQLLIGYLVHRLGMKVDLLGPEIQTHGHCGLPAG